MLLEDSEMTNATDFILLHTLLNTKLQKNVDNHLSLYGISFNEYMIMPQLMLATNHTSLRIELAEQIGLSASGVTRVLAPMEKTSLYLNR